MKKTLFVLTFILVITNISAQLHEIKINVLDVIAYKSFNATYQYVLNEESGVGVSVYFPLAEEENIFSQNEKLTFTPFYRHYFNNAFAEAFFAINSGEGKNKEDEIVTYTDGGFGFAIGKS